MSVVHCTPSGFVFVMFLVIAMCILVNDNPGRANITTVISLTIFGTGNSNLP